MTPEQIEKRLKRLERRLCCISSEIDCIDFLPVVDLVGAPATTYPLGVYDVEENFLGIANNKLEYATIWNSDETNQAVGTLSSTSQDFVFRIIYTPTACDSQDYRLFGNEVVNFPLNNFEDTLVPSAPYGLFDVDETFIGFADSGEEAAALWNSVPAYFAIATAVAVEGDDTSINLVIKTGDPLPDVRALRYWQIDAVSGTPTLYLSTDTFVRRANGVMVKSDVDGTLGAVGASSFGTSTVSLGTTAIDLVDPGDAFYKVTLTAGTNTIFHSEVGAWVWCDVFGNFANNTGYIPPTVKYMAIQSNPANNITNNLSVSNFTNANDGALENVVTVEFNGHSIPNTPANTMVDHMPNLEHFLIIEISNVNTPGTITLASFGINAANHPNLKFLGLRRNNGVSRLISITQADVEALPVVTKGFDGRGMRFVDSASLDTFLIALDTVLTGSTPVAGATILTDQNPLRTSASDTAFTNIEAGGYNIIP